MDFSFINKTNDFSRYVNKAGISATTVCVWGIKYEVQTILGNDGARWGDGGAVSAPINLASETNRKTFLIQLFRTF